MQRFESDCQGLQYVLAAIRLQEQMVDSASVAFMNKQDRQISEIVRQQRTRLRNFIRPRVPDASDVEDILQDVFYELVEANRLLTACTKSHYRSFSQEEARNLQ